MSDIGTRLQEARIKKGINQGQLAELLQCSSKAISRYENNDNLGKVYDFIKICECIDGDLNYILTGIEQNNGKEITQQEKQVLASYRMLSDSDKRIVDFILGIGDTIEQNASISEVEPSDNIVHLINMGEIIYIDTHPQPVSAGKGNIYIDDKPISRLYPSTPISLKADYCVRISGESMYPNYLNGDIVYVDSKIKDLNNGDIGIFIYNGEAFCKEYHEENGVKKLISLNPNQEEYCPIIIENDTFETQGKVIGRFHAD